MFCGFVVLSMHWQYTTNVISELQSTRPQETKFMPLKDSEVVIMIAIIKNSQPGRYKQEQKENTGRGDSNMGECWQRLGVVWLF